MLGLFVLYKYNIFEKLLIFCYVNQRLSPAAKELVTDLISSGIIGVEL